MIANMMPEVVEAVHLMYEDYPDVETDCMLFLKRFAPDDPHIASSVFDWFDEQGKCPRCGERLEVYTYKEPHPGIDGCRMETMTITMCPREVLDFG